MKLSEAQRFDRFEKAVFDDADKTAAEIIAEANRQYTETIEAAEQASEQRIESAERAESTKERERQLREVSAQKLACQREILEHRQELIDRVFEAVSEKLVRFRASDKYELYLRDASVAAWAAYPTSEGKVYIAPSDMKYAKQFDGFEVCERDSIELGGALFIFEKEGVALDFTLDSAFEEQRARFSERRELALCSPHG